MHSRLILFLTLFLLAPVLPANPLVLKSQSTTASKKLEVPDPGKLSSDWWRFFEIEAKELQDQINQAKTHYETILLHFDEATQVEIRPVLLSLNKNLLAYYNLKKKQAIPTLSEKIVLAESYTLQQWDQMVISHQEKLAAVQSHQSQFERNSNSLNAAQKKLDSKMLAYIKMDDGLSDKFALGLRIMDKKTLIEINREQLKQTKTRLDSLKKTAGQLEKIKNAAISKLKISEAELAEFELQIEDLIKQKNQMEIKIQQIESASPLIQNGNPVSQVQEQLNRQNLLQLNAELNNLTLNLTLTKAKRLLSTLLLRQPDQVIADKTLMELENWNQTLNRSLDNINNWRIATLEESNLAQSGLVQLSYEETKIQLTLKTLHEKRLQTALDTLVVLKKADQYTLVLQSILKELENKLAQDSDNIRFLFNWSYKQVSEFSDRILAWWQEPLFSIGDTPLTAFGLLRVLMIMIVAAFISSMLRKAISHLSAKNSLDQSSASALYTFGRLTHYVILLIGLMIALASIGLDFTNLALVAGALSVGVGFGLQSIVNNFVSGLILLFERTLKVGDFIELNTGLMGIVKEINVRSTLINTNDNVDIIVPNSMLVSDKVTNWTLREANRRMHIPFKVAYGSDKDLVKRAVLEAADRVSFTHKFRRFDSVDCWLVQFGESSLDFELVVWVNKEAVVRPAAVIARYMWEIESSLRQYKIQIPVPQRDMHIRSLLKEEDLKTLIKGMQPGQERTADTADSGSQ